MSFFQQHAVAIFISWYVGSAAIGALPSPTATSSMFYQFFFKFANTLAANVARAYSTQLEKSPNWTDAVNKLTKSP